MSEIRLTAPPPREELLRRLLPRLPDVVPGLRLLAQDLLGHEGRIDFVAAEPGGRVVLVLVGEEDEDLELVGRALAQRRWVEQRLPDWLQLAPNLGVRPDAAIRVLLLCASLRPETVAAARALGSEQIGLARYRCLQNGAGVEAVVELELGDDQAVEREEPAAPSTPGPRFRTGLTDSDLGLSEAEQREL